MAKGKKGVTIVIRRDGTMVMSWEDFPGKDCEEAEQKVRAALTALGVNMEMTGKEDKPGGDDDGDGANHWQRQKA